MRDLRVFAFKQDNTKLKPNDDEYSWWEYGRSFAVADGVSRTCKNGEPLSSYCAAAVFCQEVIPALVTSRSVYEPFVRANACIERLNRELHGITPETVNYLDRDYLCCVGVAGVLSRKYPYQFSYGYIGDCGVLVYNAMCIPKFLSENPIRILEEFREGWQFAEKDAKTIFWRRELRNRPEAPYLTYGALTGEVSALPYVKTGRIDLELGDVVLLFSDGIYPFIFDVAFRAVIARLLLGTSEESAKQLELKKYLEEATERLRLHGVNNLDDDRTLAAFIIIPM